eukprot:1033636-Prymnesium_polylepis.1
MRKHHTSSAPAAASSSESNAAGDESWHGISKGTLELKETVISIAISPDDSLMAAGCMNKAITIASTRSPGPGASAVAAEVAPLVEVMAAGPITSVVFFDNGTKLVSSTLNGPSVLQLWDLEAVLGLDRTAPFTLEASAVPVLASRKFGESSAAA